MSLKYVQSICGTNNIRLLTTVRYVHFVYMCIRIQIQ